MMSRSQEKFVPLSNDEEELVEAVLAAGDRIIELLDRLADGKPEGFWIELMDRLLELARFGTKLRLPYARDVPKWAEKEYNNLSPGTDVFFKRLGIVMNALQNDCDVLQSYFQEFGEGWSQAADDAVTVTTDLAELAQDFTHVRLGWDMGSAEVRVEAEWELRFGYEQHWGEHMHLAILTTHRMLCYALAEG